MKHQRHLLGPALGLLVSAIAASSPAGAEDLQMWERSGGNAGVVDRLVAMWNEKNPDRKIVLTYIPTPRWWRSSRRRSPRARFPT